MRLLLILIFCFSFNLSFAQNKKPKIKRKTVAAYQINSLKNGILLIRLVSGNHRDSLLKAQGKNEMAKQFLAQKQEENKTIITFFKAYYNFSEVLFFYSSQSKEVERGDLEKLDFLDENLQTYKSDNWKGKGIFVAEIAKLESNPDPKFQDYYTAATDTTVEVRKSYSNHDNFGFEALVFKDHQFNQLRRPFPYYERTLGGLMDNDKIIKKANTRLWKFYNKRSKNYIILN